MGNGRFWVGISRSVAWAKTVAGLVGFLVGSSSGATTPGLINGFETKLDIAKLHLVRATARMSSLDISQGASALRISFLTSGSRMFPAVTIPLGQPVDLTSCGGIALDIKNPMPQPVLFTLNLLDGANRKLVQEVTLSGGESGSFRLTHPSLEQASAVGMRHLPTPFPGVRTLVGWYDSGFDVTNVRNVNLFLRGPNSASVLSLDNLRILPSYDWNQALAGAIDPFGQWASEMWPGKLNSASDFAARNQAEITNLSKPQVQTALDSFGGSENGSPRAATGFFRTENFNGKWWFITPTGNPFFSLGINNVSMDGATVVTGRSDLFSQLPAPSDPLGQFYGWINHPVLGPSAGATTYDFYQANLYRKYGSDYRSAWAQRTLQRLTTWGFNTLGNWSDLNSMGTRRMPFTASAISGTKGASVSTGLDYWGPMPDPYDPLFATSLAQNLHKVTDLYRNDPYCIGYFVDNEANWIGTGSQPNLGIAVGTLKKQASESPAKQAFLSILQAKYGTVQSLNANWKTAFGSWSALASPVNVFGSNSATLNQDLSNFVGSFARQYFTTVKNELKQQDPNHLYLGCRFSWHCPEVLKAASETCDVMSFNIYSRNISSRDWSFLTPLNKPALISEFHFGARDRGLFGAGLVEADSQNGRAQLYQDYVQSAARCPSFIGCHWFQYVDQPTSGRAFDGENYNIGMVDITDTAYPELAQACQSTNRRIYSFRG